MVKIQIYLIDGNIIEYQVRDEMAARDHMHKIVMGGYREVKNDVLTWFPPQYILKVKAYPFKGGYYKDTKVVS